MDNNRKPLALRYRPQKFQELIGQDSMVISIQNAIKLKESQMHIYLLALEELEKPQQQEL